MSKCNTCATETEDTTVKSAQRLQSWLHSNRHLVIRAVGFIGPLWQSKDVTETVDNHLVHNDTMSKEQHKQVANAVYKNICVYA